MFFSYLNYKILKIYKLYVLYIIDINNGAYYRLWYLANNSLSLANVFKPDIFCSLKMVNYTETCGSYVFNVHINLTLCIWLV